MSEQYSRAENTHRHRSPSRTTWDDGEERLDTFSHQHGRHVDSSFLDQSNEPEALADQASFEDRQFSDEIVAAIHGTDDLISLEDARAKLFSATPATPAKSKAEIDADFRERRKNRQRASNERATTMGRAAVVADAEGMNHRVVETVPPASEPLVLAPDDAKQAAEAPIEGVVISHPEADDAPNSPDQPDVVVQGVTVDNPTAGPDPRPKKAKKAKKAKSPKASQPASSDHEPVTYGPDDQPFGPEELPLRHFVRASETYKNARDAYDEADKELASKVGRRLKLGMFATKRTRAAASAEIEAARPEYEQMAEAFDAIQIEKWKLANPDISDEEINHKLAKFHEAKLRLQGLRAQHEIVHSTGKFGKLSEWNNKATEWYAGLSKKQKVGFAIGGIAVGVAAGGLVAAAGTVLGAAAGVAGGGLLAGAKVYKTTMQGRAGLNRNTAEVNKNDFKNADGSYKSIDELRTQSSASFEQGLNQRVEKADKVNKRAKWMTIASAALLGVGVAGHIDVVHDAYKAAGDHIAGYFGLSSPEHHDVGITDSQGGGSGANEVPQYGSGDVNPNHQYDFAHPEAPAPTAPPAAPVTPPAFEVVPPDMGGATEFNPAGLDHFNEWANGHTVQPGESIWGLSRNYLQANGVQNPSVYQIDAVKDKVLESFSAKGLVDGNGWLMAGQQLITK